MKELLIAIGSLWLITLFEPVFRTLSILGVSKGGNLSQYGCSSYFVITIASIL